MPGCLDPPAQAPLRLWPPPVLGDSLDLPWAGTCCLGRTGLLVLPKEEERKEEEEGAPGLAVRAVLQDLLDREKEHSGVAKFVPQNDELSCRSTILCLEKPVTCEGMERLPPGPLWFGLCLQGSVHSLVCLFVFK